jgi:para-nitrobenzyl esterase
MAVLLAPAVIAQQPARPVVSTVAGQVQGLTSEGVLVFKGIPFAADTGGANRFLPPKRRASWQGVLDASQFGPMCPQSGNGRVYPTSPNVKSEDCLHANVWTSSLTGKRPVMVYFHGGAWSTGSSEQTDGAAAVKRTDVVIVSINNRLNVFGHLSPDPASFGPQYTDSANVGMLDLAMGLTWVRENIARFGGDPYNITVLGASGGGAKSLTSLAMPIFAKDNLIQHANIIGGHELWRRQTVAVNRARSAEVLKEAGIKPGDLAALQSIKADDLLAAYNRVARRTDPDPSAGPLGWTRYDLLMPAYGTPSLPEFSIDALAGGASKNVDVMAGLSRVDHWSAQGTDWGWMTRAQLVVYMKPILGNKTESVVAQYERLLPGASPSSILRQINSDRDWIYPNLWIAHAKAKGGGKPAYLYWVDADMVTAGMLGNGRAEPLNGDATGQFTTAFAAFARNGNPNHPGIMTWKPYKIGAPAWMVFGQRTYLVKEPTPTLKIWKNGR